MTRLLFCRSNISCLIRTPAPPLGQQLRVLLISSTFVGTMKEVLSTRNREYVEHRHKEGQEGLKKAVTTISAQ